MSIGKDVLMQYVQMKEEVKDIKKGLISLKNIRSR